MPAILPRSRDRSARDLGAAEEVKVLPSPALIAPRISPAITAPQIAAAASKTPATTQPSAAGPSESIATANEIAPVHMRQASAAMTGNFGSWKEMVNTP